MDCSNRNKKNVEVLTEFILNKLSGNKKHYLEKNQIGPPLSLLTFDMSFNVKRSCYLSIFNSF